MIDTAMLSRILSQCSSEGKTFVADSNVLTVAQAIWEEAVKAEREACAKVCVDQSIRFAEAMNGKATYGAVECERAIRARKD